MLERAAKGTPFKSTLLLKPLNVSIRRLRVLFCLFFFNSEKASLKSDGDTDRAWRGVEYRKSQENRQGWITANGTERLRLRTSKEGRRKSGQQSTQRREEHQQGKKVKKDEGARVRSWGSGPGELEEERRGEGDERSERLRRFTLSGQPALDNYPLGFWQQLVLV
ncbi:hypothetical protein BO83DRAFT_203788 [Aspergillus eucalypticola CBS 122712]|uniref:Uncharacterized protein n=1 Tax=Aspergillus eucalypticola (strain CBS 122712 / IBT 29274) TaxID=1448314 RepID=A0A317W514_ASPEC|nr:uncharacterized protein BO83DRAFT_203788 [Aspergillus eucalypticola CBS 122712]PWY80118.1 hypothetical protein BO83DRAFT_203788 [Aspergillus eucalypticola CBS 122712]